MHRLFLALVLVLSSTVQAAELAPAMRKQKFAAAGALCTTASCKVLDAVAANASDATRTFTIPVYGFSTAVIQIDLVRVSATDVQLVCTGTLNAGGSYAAVTSKTVSAGTGTVTIYHDVFATTATGGVLLTYDVSVLDRLRCIVSATTGGATDTLTVFAAAAVGG